VLGSWRDELLYYRNDGTRAQPRFVLADSALVKLTRGSYATPTLGDLDGDGDVDLLVGESSGALNFYRNDGTRSVPRFVLVADDFQGIDAGRRSAPALGDLDGDGDVDLAVGTEQGAARVYRNVGTRTSARFEMDTTLAAPFAMLPPLSAPALGDLDGDGAVELLAGGASGGVELYGQRR
jgi:hypothetical protein